MDCPECGAGVVVFRVPDELREYVPGEESVAGLCTACLALSPADGPPADPEFSAVSSAFPEGDAAVPVALLVGLLDSLAVYRSEISALADRAERAGTDPLLVVERLAHDDSLSPGFDVERRLTQLEQLLYD